MSDTVIASVTLTKKLPNRRSFSATAQLIHLEGNERPYFSVTGEERNLRRIEENQIDACGQMHVVVMEHFPELAPIIALHLCDDDGTPMHAVENGAYWLGFTSYKPVSAPDFTTFALLWRITEDRARFIHSDASNSPNPITFLTEEADRYADRWAADAKHGANLIINLAREHA